MASPQTHDGYTPIANELLEALCRLHLSGNEWSYVLALIRKTYGYHKKSDWVTNSQIALLTSMRKERVSEAKRSLIRRKIVTENRNKISLQKDYEQWVELRKTVTKVTENRNKSYGKPYTQKIKDKIYTSEANASQTKKEHMQWNKKSDDYEEGDIDLDGDGSLKKTKPTSQKKYPNAPAVRKLFQEVLGRNPSNWRINRTELQACENLFTERGLEKVRNALEFYKEHEDKEYCPSIHSPYDLDSKWSKLGEYKLKLK